MALDASQNLEDVELLARFAKGDRSAAQILTARLAPFVFAQAYRMLGDRAEAEDITQDSLLRLWYAAPDWQPGQAKVTTWLYRVASNLCIDKMRKTKRHSGEAVPELPDDRPNMERRLQDRARAQALRAALGGLPERQKQAMTLRHLEGLSNPDVAQIMQISVEAVESLMSRGKRSLAHALAPQKKALGLEDDG